MLIKLAVWKNLSKHIVVQLSVFVGVLTEVNSLQVTFHAVQQVFCSHKFIMYLGGEDGQVRIWARSGMLRSNLTQSRMSKGLPN